MNNKPTFMKLHEYAAAYHIWHYIYSLHDKEIKTTSS